MTGIFLGTDLLDLRFGRESYIAAILKTLCAEP